MILDIKKYVKEVKETFEKQSKKLISEAQKDLEERLLKYSVKKQYIK